MNACDALESFGRMMNEAGIAPPEVIKADGCLHRFHVEGDRRGSLNGWYLLHMDHRAAGAFGSWKTGVRANWAADGKRMSETDRAAFALQLDEARTKAKAERRSEYEARAVAAQCEWTTAAPANPLHRYLIAKQVKAHNLRQVGTTLIVPLLDAYGLLWNVQRIEAIGAKRFRPGRAGGLFSPIGDLTNPDRLLICEGWATGATLHEETGHTILCAMNASNMRNVAETARAAWPCADLVICADNDRYTQGNPGITAATAAAEATGARLIVPQFPVGASGTDFNDLALIKRGRGVA